MADSERQLLYVPTENDALLTERTVSGNSGLNARLGENVKASSLKSSIANLALGVLGAGQLTLPFAIKSAGILLGSTILLILGSLAVYTLHLLHRCQAATGQSNYGAILADILGPFYRRVADVLLGFYAWGGGISFLMLVMGEQKRLAESWGYDVSHATLLGGTVLFVVLPLSLLRSLDRLKFTSYVGAFGAIYIMICVVISAPWDGMSLDFCGLAKHPHEHIRWGPESAVRAIGAVPLAAFALNSAWCFVSILTNLEDPTDSRVYTLITVSNTIILFNYVMIAIFGYLSFCGDTSDNILANLPSTPYVMFARCMLVIQLCCALPLRFHVTRNIFEEMIVRKFELEHLSEAALWGIHAGLTVLIVGSAALLAVVSDSLHVVIGLTSAVCASFVIYILPSLAYYTLLSNENAGKLELSQSVPPLLCGVFGVWMCFSGTIVNLIELAHGGKVHG